MVWQNLCHRSANDTNDRPKREVKRAFQDRKIEIETASLKVKMVWQKWFGNYIYMEHLPTINNPSEGKGNPFRDFHFLLVEVIVWQNYYQPLANDT